VIDLTGILPAFMATFMPGRGRGRAYVFHPSHSGRPDDAQKRLLCLTVEPLARWVANDRETRSFAEASPRTSQAG
jgi:hypothetical protein